MANDAGPVLADRRAVQQSSGAVRAPGGDGAGVVGTNGARIVTSGWTAMARRLNGRDLWRCALAVLAFSLINTPVNILTAQADNPDVAAWMPMVWEVSSTLAAMAVIWIPWLAASLAPPDEAAGEGWRPKARFAGIHLAALLTFSAVHVSGFVALRKLGYAVMGAGAYQFGDRFSYELRKDLVTYVLLVGGFLLTAYLRRRRDEPVRPVSFDIRDGARIIRAPLADILAVSSAGNYVEFLLADGRRPLMRATLAAVEAELSRFGFVRVHRSWLVNVAVVRGLTPEGSGDYAITLDGALVAPLSRRYPEALQRL
ncbi:MAG: LytTR family DNA-binding domain-containing protein, partial [Brevundimonas sp.]